jgi:hypothetical protein
LVRLNQSYGRKLEILTFYILDLNFRSLIFKSRRALITVKILRSEKIDIYTKILNSKISNLIFVDLISINIGQYFFDSINLDPIKKTSSLSFPQR